MRKFLFSFQQQVLRREGCSYLRHHIPADTHSEAFAVWCALPAIQDVEMGQLGELKLTVKEMVK